MRLAATGGDSGTAARACSTAAEHVRAAHVFAVGDAQPVLALAGSDTGGIAVVVAAAAGAPERLGVLARQDVVVVVVVVVEHMPHAPVAS
jgi:hypothetical protein